ncbi:MAG: hypothetical protein MUF81_03035 [Verrucomicrobia bacterium]|nr:hypothetical protein [Verrucomicrobiota bacterium]
MTFAVGGTITVTSHKNVSADTVLDASGHAVTISGGNSVRLFTVTNGVNLTLRQLTLANGKTSTNGGAIYNRGNLSAYDCVFTNNSATGVSGTIGTNGADASGAGQAGNGIAGTAGGSALGGAIYNSGTLALTGCVFQNNSATAGSGGSGGNGGNAPWYAGNGGAGGAGGVAKGGAIYSANSVFLTNCTFATNSTTGGNSGNGGSGGAGYYFGSNARAGVPGEGSGASLYTLQKCIIDSSSFYGNAARGGNAGTNGATTIGFQNDSGRNGGDSLGGGVCNLGTNVVINSTFCANTVAGGIGGTGSGAGSLGGAGGNGGTGAGGSLYSSVTIGVTNCTFSSSDATGGSGGNGGPSPGGSGPTGSNGAERGADIANSGGVFVLQSCILGNLLNQITITSVTNVIPISTNTPPPGGCIAPTCTQSTNHLPAGCVTNCTQTNIVYYSNAVTYQTNIVITIGNADGTFTDAGHNLSSDNTPAFSGASHNSTDPKLGPLAANGGPTKTMLLLAGSPAVNAGGDAGLAVDQRGFPRPSGAHCDIGAVEMQLPPALTPSFDQTNFRFTFRSETGLVYIVEFKDTLNDPAWKRLSTNAGTAGFLTLTNAIGGGGTTSRFFRVVIK